jgi:hypothetical protein
MSYSPAPGPEPAPPPEAWNEELVAELPGKLVLVGITHLNPDGSLEKHEQFFGYVLEAAQQRGIQLRLEGSNGGKAYWLPPDTRAFQIAPLGQYRLRSTGEVVNDPDYTCTWTLRAPKQ